MYVAVLILPVNLPVRRLVSTAKKKTGIYSILLFTEEPPSQKKSRSGEPWTTVPQAKAEMAPSW